MSFGFEFSPSITKQPSSVIYDPSALALTGWWVAGNYNSTTETWAGKASAGTSGSNTLSHATGPTDGAALNGLLTVAFSRAGSQRLNGIAISNFIAAGAYSFWVLFRSTTQAADNVNPNLDDCLFADSGGFLACGGRSTGPAMILQHDSSGQKRVSRPFANNAWQLVRGRKTATHLELSVNSDPFTQGDAAGNLGSVAGTLRVGCNFNQTIFYDGLIAEIALVNQLLDVTTLDLVKNSYMFGQYGLTWS